MTCQVWTRVHECNELRRHPALRAVGLWGVMSKLCVERRWSHDDENGDTINRTITLSIVDYIRLAGL